MPAYGYTIVITSSFGALAARHHAPDVLESFLYLVGATAGFSVLGALGALAFEEKRSETRARSRCSWAVR